MEKKEIEYACRAYGWSSKTGKPAPWPAFDKKKINQKLIPHPERAKDWNTYIEGNEGCVEWITQESVDPSDEFNKEIIRSFKENGLKEGDIIHVEYSMRGESYSTKYDLTI